MIDLKSLPKDPGCYIFKDKSGSIIYIGKAKNIKKRVSSYFLKKNHDDKTSALVRNIADAEFFATTNEQEAFILENNLIKKHRPKYNIDLKDSRRYAHIFIPDERYPRLLVARDRNENGKYFGPFINAEMRDEIIKILRSTFLIRTCRALPKKACLRFHIGLCSAPCVKNITEEDYAKNMEAAESFLKGDVKDLITRLKENMKRFSDGKNYEKARLARDRISALATLTEKQNFEKEKRYDEDIINYIISGDKLYLIIFNINKGILASKNEFSFDIFTDGFLEDFITQYYAENPVPKEIILPHSVHDDSIKRYLEKLRGGKVDLTVPQKGDKHDLLELVKRNIEISFLRENEMICELRKTLRMNSNPEVIECFDISNTQGTNSVASMVQFVNGKPEKSGYRRFRIKTVSGSDDFASIKEVVKRRYFGLKSRNEKMPDLIVVDGGKGQLRAALEALSELELKIPIISLAKKLEEVYVPGLPNPIHIGKDSKALKLLIQLRNEAHRFAIKYHRLLRSKEMTR